MNRTDFVEGKPMRKPVIFRELKWESDVGHNSTGRQNYEYEHAWLVKSSQRDDIFKDYTTGEYQEQGLFLLLMEGDHNRSDGIFTLKIKAGCHSSSRDILTVTHPDNTVESLKRIAPDVVREFFGQLVE